MKPLVSYVVPVYNTEKKISKCVESILGDGDNNVEVLLIDDGSTDSSYKICEEIVRRNKKVKCCTHENKGVSYTRNIGIDQAVGEFLIFVDSDDYVDGDTIYNLLMQLDKSRDIIFWGYERIEKKGNTRILPGIKDEEYRSLPDALFESLFQTCILHNIGTKAYKSSLIQANHIKFSEQIAAFEDITFALKALKYARDVFVCNKSLYHYVIYNNSLNRSFRNNYYDGVMELHKELLENNIEEKFIYTVLYDNYIKTIMNELKLDKEIEHRETLKIIDRIIDSKEMQQIGFLVTNMKWYKKILFLLCSYKKRKLVLLMSQLLSRIY